MHWLACENKKIFRNSNKNLIHFNLYFMYETKYLLNKNEMEKHEKKGDIYCSMYNNINNINKTLGNYEMSRC